LLYTGRLRKDTDILVLGLGSEILMDDGIPLKIIADLKKDPLTRDLNYLTANTGGLDLLDHFSGFRNVFIIDTIMTKNGVPGQVWFFNAKDEDCMDTFHLSCCHDASFEITLGLGKKLGIPLPEQIWILAVEILRGLEFSRSSSEQVDSVYPGILAEVKKNINHIICSRMARSVAKI
jgi:hydrogenase maturation protease